MRNRIYQLAFLTVFVLLYTSGCKESPTENYYYINIVDSLSNPEVDPRVIFTNPAAGSIGPYGSTDPTQYEPYHQITIQFNKLVNLNNFGGNPFSLKTEDTEYQLYLNDNTGILTNILIFNMGGSYLAAKTYTLTVDTTFIDVHGKRLREPFIASFVPEPKFRLYKVYPVDNEIEPTQLSYIYLFFNSKVDETIFNSLSVSPDIAGNWTMNLPYYNNDSSTVYFQISDTLCFNTEYTVAISADARDLNGLLIDRAYQLTFKTVPFRVNLNGYSGYIGPGGFYIMNDFSFRFNSTVDTSTVRNSITVTPQIAYDLWFPYGSNSNYLRIDFNDEEFQNNTEYTIHFAATIKSTKGDALEAYSYSFSTGP